ncbi:hypothetical protein [Clostridium botulinum]|uniref:hypothetical protein n=1 Tax=Clostridium botulinum TaxID=1491 RepID=UPI000774DDF9|nr:hypothetical protein [Clostridium botulinum]NFL38717.1 hypothetical protein [Clostridium botulinum]NFL66817.1 hypothetical protein [Clostridium botulinum]NFN09687.1 hypothetical protein [Clostridium botulinum]NFN24542.1 hypothetical protein [Clostridium botulinum]NFN31809.1 hypothetical protein [Clostridium botulinum]
MCKKKLNINVLNSYIGEDVAFYKKQQAVAGLISILLYCPKINKTMSLHNIKKEIKQELGEEISLKANQYCDELNNYGENIEEILNVMRIISKSNIITGTIVRITDTNVGNNLNNGKETLERAKVGKYLRTFEKSSFEKFLEIRIALCKLSKYIYNRFNRYSDDTDVICLTHNYMESSKKFISKCTTEYVGPEVILNLEGLVSKNEELSELNLILNKNGKINLCFEGDERGLCYSEDTGLYFEEFFAKDEISELFNIKIKVQDITIDIYNELLKTIVRTHKNKKISLLGTIAFDDGSLQKMQLKSIF